MNCIIKYCSACFKTCLHNPMGKAGEFRCTYCGTPVTSTPKREQQEAIRQKQIAKARTEMFK